VAVTIVELCDVVGIRPDSNVAGGAGTVRFGKSARQAQAVSAALG